MRRNLKTISVDRIESQKEKLAYDFECAASEEIT
jgi:hypothetical protein